MAENKNTFQTTVESLMKGMDGFVSSKTVVGEPIQVGETSFFRWWMCLLVWVPVHSAEKKRKTAVVVSGARCHRAPFW